VGVEHHLLRLARIGPHEQHPAVAEPDLRHLHRHRDPGDQHHLVAPVELVGLARREAQRHERRHRRRGPLALPAGRVPPHRVVAALVAEPAQLLEDPDQRQPLPARPRRIHRQQPVELLSPRPDLRLRLHLPLVDELRRPAAHHPPHGLPRNLQLPADLLDRLLLDEIRAPDLGDRLHNQHPNLGSRSSLGSTVDPHAKGVPFGSRSPRKRGPYSTPINMSGSSLIQRYRDHPLDNAEASMKPMACTY
jgi:hypothetical protein